MAYADITINDPSPLKRMLQRNRFIDAIALYPLELKPVVVSDFGGGDGELCLRLRSILSKTKIMCYEPSQSMFSEAVEKIARKNVVLLNRIAEIETDSIDVVYCMEVLEHLPDQEVEKAINDIYSIMKLGGIAIVGVPNEIYLAALYKGLFRMRRRFGEFDASPLNILKCVFGVPPPNRPLGEISPNIPYHFYHLGFDHRKLEKLLSRKFEVLLRKLSPFKFRGVWGCPEIYYMLRKAKPEMTLCNKNWSAKFA